MPGRTYEVDYQVRDNGTAPLGKIAQAWGQVAQAQQKAQQAVGAGAGGMGGLLGGMLSTVTNMLTSWLSVGNAIALCVQYMNDLKKATQEANAAQDKYAEAAQRTRNALREGQATAKESPDDISKTIDLAKATGSSVTDAGKIRQAYYGAADPSVSAFGDTGGKQGMSKAQSDEFVKRVAKMGTALGADPEAFGTLAGRMVANDFSLQTADAAEAEAKEALALLVYQGTGKVDQLSNALTKTAPEMTGAGDFQMRSVKGTSAMLASETKVASPAESGQRLLQAYRGLKKLADSPENMEKLGLKKGMSFDESMDQLGTFDPVALEAMLDGMNLGGVRAARSIRELARAGRSGEVQRLMEDTDKGKSAATLQKHIDDYQKTETHKTNVADAEVEVAKIEQGDAAAAAHRLDKRAEASLRGRDGLDTVGSKNRDVDAGMARWAGRMMYGVGDVFTGGALGMAGGGGFRDAMFANRTDPGEEMRRKQGEGLRLLLEQNPKARGSAEAELLGMPGVEQSARARAIRNIERGDIHKAANVTAPRMEQLLEQVVVLLAGTGSHDVTAPPPAGRDVGPAR